MVVLSHVIVGWTVGLLPLVLPSASPSPQQPVYPPQSSGIAASLFGGFFAVGLIMAVWILLHLKPKPQQPYTGPND